MKSLLGFIKEKVFKGLILTRFMDFLRIKSIISKTPSWLIYGLIVSVLFLLINLYFFDYLQHSVIYQILNFYLLSYTNFIFTHLTLNLFGVDFLIDNYSLLFIWFSIPFYFFLGAIIGTIFRVIKKRKRESNRLPLILSFLIPGLGQLIKKHYLKSLLISSGVVLSFLLFIWYSGLGILTFYLFYIYNINDAFSSDKKNSKVLIVFFSITILLFIFPLIRYISVSNVHEQTDTVLNFALEENNPNLCEDLEYFEDDRCYFSFASETKNYTICNEIGDKFKMAECYSNIAIILNNPKICDKTDLGWSNECYFYTAAKTNNKSLCKEIKKGYYSQRKCYIRTLI